MPGAEQFDCRLREENVAEVVRLKDQHGVFTRAPVWATQPSGKRGQGAGLSWIQHKEIHMPVIAWLLGVPITVIILFMLLF